MTTRLAVHVVQRAAQEIAEASEWWRKNRQEAPEAVREELQRAFDLISLQLNIGARAVNAGLPGIRRVHLARIRYHLYYRATSSAVEVLALWHSSRGAGPRV